MKINVKPTSENVRFVVKPERRKVVCIISNAKNYLEDFIDLWKNGWSAPWKVEDNLRMPDRFVGVATCDENDEWNEEIGKAIAFSRAKYKLHNSFFKRANTFVNECDRALAKLITSLNDYGEHLSMNADKREKWITEKVGSEVFFGEE